MKIVKGILKFGLLAVLLGSIAFSVFTPWSVNVNENDTNDSVNSDAVSNGAATPVLQMIERLQKDILFLTTERDRVAQELLNSQLSNELKEQLIYELENNILNMQFYIQELNKIILELQYENELMSAYISELEEIRYSLIQACYALEQLVEGLNQGLLESRFCILFMFNDSIYSVQMIPVDGRIQIENPVSTDYVIFLGWSLSLNGELVNLSEIEVTGDMVIYAKITRKYNVNFVYENTSYANYIVEVGNTKTVTAPITTERKKFLGWTLNGVTVIDPAIHSVYEHTTWFAKVETCYLVTFAYKHGEVITNIGTQYRATANNIIAPIAPTFTGYTFGGWTLNQSIVTPTAITLLGDVIFFARYTATMIYVSSEKLPTPKNTLNQGRQYSVNSCVDKLKIDLSDLIDSSGTLGEISVYFSINIGNGLWKSGANLVLGEVFKVDWATGTTGGVAWAQWVTFSLSKSSNIMTVEAGAVSPNGTITPHNTNIVFTSISYKFIDEFKY